MLSEPMQLGGHGKVVQIDESVLVRAKYNRGRQLRERQRWLFGVYDPATKQGYIQLVEDRSADTLLPITQRVVAPGKLSDCNLMLSIHLFTYKCVRCQRSPTSILYIVSCGHLKLLQSACTHCCPPTQLSTHIIHTSSGYTNC